MGMIMVIIMKESYKGGVLLSRTIQVIISWRKIKTLCVCCFAKRANKLTAQQIMRGGRKCVIPSALQQPEQASETTGETASNLCTNCTTDYGAQ